MSSTSLRVGLIALVITLASSSLAQADDEAVSFPIEIIDRPFTLPTGVWQADLDLFADKEFNNIGTAVGGDYGLTNQLQLGLSYEFGLKTEGADFDGKGALVANGLYTFFESEKLYGVAVADIGYSFLDEDPTPLDLGALIWYTVVPSKVAVYVVPTLSIALAREAGDIGVEGPRPVFVSIPLIFAAQATTNIYAEVGTELASIEIADSETTVFGADTIPLDLTGFFALSNKLDVGAGISWGDLSDDAGAFDLFALLRLRGGL